MIKIKIQNFCMSLIEIIHVYNLINRENININPHLYGISILHNSFWIRYLTISRSFITFCFYIMKNIRVFILVPFFNK